MVHEKRSFIVNPPLKTNESDNNDDDKANMSTAGCYMHFPWVVFDEYRGALIPMPTMNVCIVTIKNICFLV